MNKTMRVVQSHELTAFIRYVRERGYEITKPKTNTFVITKDNLSFILWKSDIFGKSYILEERVANVPAQQ